MTAVPGLLVRLTPWLFPRCRTLLHRTDLRSTSIQSRGETRRIRTTVEVSVELVCGHGRCWGEERIAFSFSKLSCLDLSGHAISHGHCQMDDSASAYDLLHRPAPIPMASPLDARAFTVWNRLIPRKIKGSHLDAHPTWSPLTPALWSPSRRDPTSHSIFLVILQQI